jgi:hypothetical protein
MELDDAAERSPVYVEAEIAVGSVANHDEVSLLFSAFILVDVYSTHYTGLYRFDDE